MKTITVTYAMPDDMDAFEQAHRAPVAWSAISEALIIIRSHFKHGDRTQEEVIERVRDILSDAQGVIECH